MEQYTGGDQIRYSVYTKTKVAVLPKEVLKGKTPVEKNG